MPRMGKHSPAESANKRARASAWLVFISMAGTTMSFQVYHSVKHGHLPLPLAVLYGVVPLFISMLVIEVVSGWEDAPEWVRWAAYVIIGGAMYLSAAATGAVVLQAAPPHSSLLFGLLLDGAAILAARFLMTAVKSAAVAELAALRSALAAGRDALLEVEAERDTARKEAAGAAARAEEAEDAARQLGERHQGGTPGQEPARRKGGTTAGTKGSTAARKSAAKDPAAQAAEVVTHAEAELILAAEPGISGSELGRRLGTTPGYGRKLKRELTSVAPGGEG